MGKLEDDDLAEMANDSSQRDEEIESKYSEEDSTKQAHPTEMDDDDDDGADGAEEEDAVDEEAKESGDP